MRLYIIGAGKYGLEIEDIASQLNKYEGICFLDDKATNSSVVGKCADFSKFISTDAEYYVAFGDNSFRLKWINEVKNSGGNAATIVHPTAYISPKAKLGEFVAVLPKAVVNSYSIIEDGAIINTGAIIDHDSVIGECAHICVGAIVKADNRIPAGMKIEAGVVIERETYL